MKNHHDSKKNTLYFASNLTNKKDRHIIGTATRDEKLDPYDSGETPEQTKIRLGIKAFNHIQKILSSSPQRLPIDLSGVEDFDDIDLVELVIPLLETETARYLSPSVEASSSFDVKFFSNIDLLILPSSINEDMSGVYYADANTPNGEIIVLSKVGVFDGYGNAGEIEKYSITTDGYEAISVQLKAASNLIRRAFFERHDGLHLFMLSHEWSSRESFSRECLPHEIHFTQVGGKITAKIPCFISYGEEMYCETMRLAYYNTARVLANWFGVDKTQIEIEVERLYELIGFKAGENVWIEALHGCTKREPHEDRFWWNQEIAGQLSKEQHGTESISSFLMAEGATSVAYFSFVEHDGGLDVAYTVSAFKGRERLLCFMVSLFDRDGEPWLAKLRESLGSFSIPLIHSAEKEDNWGMNVFSEDFPFVIPDAPKIATEKFSVIGMYLSCERHRLLTGTPQMIDVKDVPEILSLGINAPLPFSGVVSSPFYVKTDDLSSPLARCEDLIMEAIEDGFQLSDDRLAEKLKFEFGAGVTAAGGGVGVLCLVILNIAENDLINYMASGDLAPGEVRNKALIQRLNKFSPGLGVSNVVLVPHLKDVA